MEVVRWSRLGSDQGNAIAKFNLRNMYADGEGVPENDATAYKWFNLAASRSSSEIRENVVEERDRLAARLTPDEGVEGQRFALELDAAHPRD